MNVASLKAGDRVDGLQPYTIESVEKSGLNGEYLAVVVYDNGLRDRVDFPADTETRCAAVFDFEDGGDRCQLAVHADDRHVAFAQNRPDYVSGGYRTWGADWPTPAVVGDDLEWADGFPGIEHNRALDSAQILTEQPKRRGLLRRK